jgi:TonB family protein
MFLLVAALTTYASAFAAATDLKVIANGSIRSDTISPAELKSIYLEEKDSLSDGSHAQPVLQKDGSVHRAFLEEYLGRTDDDLRTFYRALIFTGRGSLPKELGSDAEVVAYVTKTRGAIGYISTESSADGVKTLTVVRSESNFERKIITRVEPDYPEILKQLSIGGTVRLRLTVAAKGNVENIQVLGGNPILAESAAAAVKQWVYSTGHSRSSEEVTIPFDPNR